MSAPLRPAPAPARPRSPLPRPCLAPPPPQGVRLGHRAAHPLPRRRNGPVECPRVRRVEGADARGEWGWFSYMAAGSNISLGTVSCCRTFFFFCFFASFLCLKKNEPRWTLSSSLLFFFLIFFSRLEWHTSAVRWRIWSKLVFFWNLRVIRKSFAPATG